MVGFFKLIFDDDLSAIGVLTIQVEAKGSNGFLPLFNGDVEIKGLVEVVDVVLQPHGEIGVFAAPNLPQRNMSNLSDLHPDKVGDF